MDPVPLILLVVVLVGAAVLLPFLVRLQRAARQALEAARGMEARLEALRAEQDASDGPPPEDRPGG